MAHKRNRRKYGLVMEVDIPTNAKLKRALGVDANGDVQKHVTETVFKRLKPYIPRLSGALRSNAKISSPTKITVSGVYARAQFFGVTKSGKPFDYGVLGGAKAGSHWDRRLAADEGKAIVADANRYVRSRKR